MGCGGSKPEDATNMSAEPKSPPQNDMPLKPAEVRVEVPKHAEPPKQEEPPASSMIKQVERRRQ